MTRQEAIEALRAEGIAHPSRQLVEDYMRVQQADEWALELLPEPTEAKQELPGSAGSANPPRPSTSRSNLKPVLRAAGQLERPRGPRRPGRPAVIASYFPKLALIMSDGTPLREALRRCGVEGVTPKVLRSHYRNTVLTRLRREARQKWQSEYGFRRTRTRRQEFLRSL